MNKIKIVQGIIDKRASDYEKKGFDIITEPAVLVYELLEAGQYLNVKILDENVELITEKCLVIPVKYLPKDLQPYKPIERKRK